VSISEDGDWVVLNAPRAPTIYEKDNAIVHRDAVKHTASEFAGRQGELPPLHGQGNSTSSRKVVGHTLARYVDMATDKVVLPVHCRFDFKKSSGSRSSPAAPRAMRAFVAKYWFERAAMARVPVEVDVPSEFRYRECRCAWAIWRISFRNPARPPDTLRRCATPSRRAHTLSVVNVATSTIARESETVAADALAGPRIGVASTKAFTCQLMVLASLAVAAGKARGELSGEARPSWCMASSNSPPDGRGADV